MVERDATLRRMGIEGFVGIAMLARLHSFSERRLFLAAVLTVLATAHLDAQNVNGSMAVSATVLPPGPTEATRLIAFSVGRDGVGQVESTAPEPGSVAQIVMWTVSSSANGFIPVEQAPMRIQAKHQGESSKLAASSRAAARLRYEVDLGGASDRPSDSSSRDVTVRINYLIVPGT